MLKNRRAVKLLFFVLLINCVSGYSQNNNQINIKLITYCCKSNNQMYCADLIITNTGKKREKILLDSVYVFYSQSLNKIKDSVVNDTLNVFLFHTSQIISCDGSMHGGLFNCDTITTYSKNIVLNLSKGEKYKIRLTFSSTQISNAKYLRIYCYVLDDSNVLYDFPNNVYIETIKLSDFVFQ